MCASIERENIRKEEEEGEGEGVVLMVGEERENLYWRERNELGKYKKLTKRTSEIIPFVSFSFSGNFFNESVIQCDVLSPNDNCNHMSWERMICFATQLTVQIL